MVRRVRDVRAMLATERQRSLAALRVTTGGGFKNLVRTIVHFRVPATPMGRLTIWAIAIYSLVQGAGITIGGAVRWTSPAYSIVRSLPGAPASWGVALFAGGIIIMVGSALHRFHVKAFGLTLVAIWSFCFAVGAQWATWIIPTAGTTGGPAYFLHFVAALAVLFIDETKRTAPHAHT